MSLTEADTLKWMSAVASEEHLHVRQLLLVSPTDAPLATRPAETLQPSRSTTLTQFTPFSARYYVENWVRFHQRDEPILIRAEDGLVVIVRIRGTDRTLVADVAPIGGIEGVVGAALLELAEFLAGNSDPPRLRRDGMN